MIHGKTKQVLYSFVNYNFYHRRYYYGVQINCLYTLNDHSWQYICPSPKMEHREKSLCMVDNDRFITVIENDSLQANLIGLNNGECQILKDMNMRKRNIHSVYNETYDEIIVCGIERMERYDINKSKWMIFNRKESFKEIMDVRIYDGNPNIVNIFGIGRGKEPNFQICQIDTRCSENLMVYV